MPFKMAFRWWADDGPLIVVFGSSHQLKKKPCQSWICACSQTIYEKLMQEQKPEQTGLELFNMGLHDLSLPFCQVQVIHQGNCYEKASA